MSKLSFPGACKCSPVHTCCNISDIGTPGICYSQGCPQDVKSQDRDETETFHFFTVRLCEAYTHGIAIEILSVRLSVKRVYCDKTKAPSEKKFNYDK